jgi:Putative MetA-pathway of phenol degradation
LTHRQNWAASAIVALFIGTPLPASAQQRPLVTEDPEVIGAGRILLEGGVTHGRDVFLPASGLHGDVTTIPELGVSIGLGSIVEAQIDGPVWQRMHVRDRESGPLSNLLDFSGDDTGSTGDVVVGTKVRLLGETAGRPAIGLRMATKLPNASNESGLGLDTIDFYSALLLGKTVRSVRIVGNFGLGILSDPTNGTRQNDVFTYGLSLARALTNQFEVVAEVNGRMNARSDHTPPGTESRSLARAGARFTQATVRLDGALLLGLTSRDPSWGFTIGATYVFNAITVP